MVRSREPLCQLEGIEVYRHGFGQSFPFPDISATYRQR